MTALGLSSLTDQDLRTLAAAIERGDLRPPLSATSLQARGFGHLADTLRPYFALNPEGVQALIEVTIAERTHRKVPKLTLVWTGDDPGVSHSRHTRVVLPELFARARSHVLVAGYAIDNGAQLFASLHQVMAMHGVTAHFFVDIHQLTRRLEQQAKADNLNWSELSAPLKVASGNKARGHAVVVLFFQLMWPFGGPYPDVYFDPRTADNFSLVSLHAKCVIIDHEYTLLTSANFTNRGQMRNLEAGVAIEDRTFAASLERQWLNLIQAGVVIRG
jgi:phosphatidylserine/phosphatidylglycerophosphate/cardiolipin synthase-like enzyme